MRVTDLDKVVL